MDLLQHHSTGQADGEVTPGLLRGKGVGPGLPAAPVGQGGQQQGLGWPGGHVTAAYHTCNI